MNLIHCVCGEELPAQTKIQTGAAICVSCGRCFLVLDGKVAREAKPNDFDSLNPQQLLVLIEAKLTAVGQALLIAGQGLLEERCKHPIYDNYQEVLDTFMCAEGFDLARIDSKKADQTLQFVNAVGLDVVLPVMVRQLGAWGNRELAASFEAMSEKKRTLEAFIATVRAAGEDPSSNDWGLSSGTRTPSGPHASRAPVAHQGAVRQRRRRN